MPLIMAVNYGMNLMGSAILIKCENKYGKIDYAVQRNT